MRRIIFISITGIVALILCIVAFVVFQHFQAGKYITIRFSDVKNVSLVQFKTSRQIGTVEQSGDKVYIQKDRRYQVAYTGNDGYESGSIDIDNSKDEVVVKPFYSNKKLESMLDATKIKSIHAAIRKSYPNVNKTHTIQKGKLYHYGEWYSTSLTYKKGYSFESDTLRMILKEVSGEWKVVAAPNITLDRFTHSSVPVDILRQINDF